MNRFVLVVSLFIIIFVASCTFDKNDETINNIQGNWVFDTSSLPNIGSGRLISKIRDNCGFEFFTDSCNMKCAFYRKNESNICEGMTEGVLTKFDIKNDSLRIWDFERKSWHSYLIRNLTKDSLVLFDQNMQYDIKYVRPSNSKNSSFDGIIISKLFLGGGYECIDESFYFDKHGYFYYKNSKDKALIHWVNQFTVDSLFLGFSHLDINSLAYEYIGGGTGASVHYSVSFIKDGKVIKRVIDHQNTGPDELLQAYTSLINSFRKLEGSTTNVNNSVSKLVREEFNIFCKKMGVN